MTNVHHVTKMKPTGHTARPLTGTRPWDTIDADTTDMSLGKAERENMRVSRENSPYKRFLAELDGKPAKRHGRRT